MEESEVDTSLSGEMTFTKIKSSLLRRGLGKVKSTYFLQGVENRASLDLKKPHQLAKLSDKQTKSYDSHRIIEVKTDRQDTCY